MSDKVREAFGWALVLSPTRNRDDRVPLPGDIDSIDRQEYGNVVFSPPGQDRLTIGHLLIGLLQVDDETGHPSALRQLNAFLGLSGAQVDRRLREYVSSGGLVLISSSAPAVLGTYPLLADELDELLHDAEEAIPEGGVLTTRIMLAFSLLPKYIDPLDAVLRLGPELDSQLAGLLSDILTLPDNQLLSHLLDEKLGRFRRTPVRPLANSDQPAIVDSLGFRPVVEGLVDLLDASETTLPLTLGLTAPWGGGKSSIMLQLRELLLSDRTERRWTVVSFPAWRYETAGQMWAALARKIYVDALDQMDHFWQRWIFRGRLELKRLPRATVIARFAGSAVAGVLGYLAGTQLLGSGTGPAGISLGGGLGGLAAFAAAGNQLWGSVADPFKSMLDAYLATPRPELTQPFDSEAEKSIDELMKLLTRDENRALAVLVDDLDRCSPRNVVGTIEAVNQIFNSRANGRLVFIVAMDREVVATSIEAAYGPLIERLKGDESPLADGFGSHFLAKVVQLSIAVPKPASMNLTQLITANAVVARTETTAPGRFRLPFVRRRQRRPAGPSEGQIQQQMQRLRQEGLQNPGDFYRARQRLEQETKFNTDRAALAEAARRLQSEVIELDAPDVVVAEMETLKFLERNPRQVKRFDNAFRLQLHVLNRTRTADFNFDYDSLRAVGRWVAIGLRWPAFIDDVANDPRLLTALEDAAGRRLTKGKRRVVAAGEDVPPRWDDWVGNDQLIAALAEKPTVSSLPDGAFVRVS